MKLPFDLGKVFHITIKIQDYFIYFNKSSLALSFWYNPDDRVSDYMFFTSYLKTNDTYIDIGANIGTTLIPAAKIVKGGKVIGFEPHPKIYKYLTANVSLNNMENRVEIQNCALGKERGYVHFSSYRADDENKVLLAGDGIKVPIKLLDDIGDMYTCINLIKIDVEGYEKFVIDGGIKTLKKTDCVYFEVSEEMSGSYRYTMKDLLLSLEEIGFHIFVQKEPKILEAINFDYKLDTHHTNAFAIRNIKHFLERTGWHIYDDIKYSKIK
jgi:FkbM family methyltransferase